MIIADVNPCLCCILLHPTNCADPTSPNVSITLKIVSEDNSSVATTFRVADSNDLMRLNRFVDGLSRCLKYLLTIFEMLSMNQDNLDI